MKMNLESIIASLRVIADYEDCRVWKGNITPEEVACLGQFIETDISYYGDDAVEYWTLSADGAQLIHLADIADRHNLRLATK